MTRIVQIEADARIQGLVRHFNHHYTRYGEALRQMDGTAANLHHEMMSLHARCLAHLIAKAVDAQAEGAEAAP